MAGTVGTMANRNVGSERLVHSAMRAYAPGVRLIEHDPEICEDAAFAGR